MAKERVAVIGVGQTKHQATRGDVSMAGLVREAASRALDRRRDDLDRHRRRRHRQGPRLLRGRDDARAVPGRRARGARASRCSGCTRPGRSAGPRAIVAAQLVQAGIHERVLTVAFEKQSESEAMWALSLPDAVHPAARTPAPAATSPPTSAPTWPAPGSPDHIGILVALKDRQNALKNPYAHLHEHDISFDSIKDSMMLWDPIRYAETCPSSDGACAMVLGSEAVADARRRAGGLGARARPCGPSRPCPPTATRCCRAAAPTAPPTCYAPGRHHRPPRARSTAWRCTCPFSWFEPMWLENLGFAAPARAGRCVEDGVTQLDGDLPVNMSGGVLSSNPIGASGMLRFAEAALQVRGHGRRAPGRRRPHRGGPRLRRRLAVLRHVGRRAPRSHDRSPRGQGGHRHRRRPRAGRGRGPPVRGRGGVGAAHRRARRRGRGGRRVARRRGRLPAPRRHLGGRVDRRGGRRRGALRPGQRPRQQRGHPRLLARSTSRTSARFRTCPRREPGRAR